MGGVVNQNNNFQTSRLEVVMDGFGVHRHAIVEGAYIFQVDVPSVTAMDISKD